MASDNLKEKKNHVWERGGNCIGLMTMTNTRSRAGSEYYLQITMTEAHTKALNKGRKGENTVEKRVGGAGVGRTIANGGSE
jgi:hypothetical protein